MITATAVGPRIAVLDYGMGNRRSVQKALERCGARAQITRGGAELAAADGVVVPGVGAFPLAMRRLREYGLDRLLREIAADGRPLLGICLGMQLLFERSEELAPTGGLGLIGGEVTRLRAGGLRVPHIGWNAVRFERDCALAGSRFASGAPERPYYHVHSYAARPSDPADVAATTEYGERFATVVTRGNVSGVQFHPEKSSRDGLRMLEAFVATCAPARAGSAA